MHIPPPTCKQYTNIYAFFSMPRLTFFAMCFDEINIMRDRSEHEEVPEEWIKGKSR